VDGVERAESLRSSDYLTDDTTSQYGIAAVVAGVPERVPRHDGSAGGDVARRVIPVLVRSSGIGP
jgi:hypothetical protein